MWFVFALLTSLIWGGADVFYKLSSGGDERLSYLKITVAVGFVMGAHALVYCLIYKPAFSFSDIVLYSPVSALYILSMVLGYVGFRYLQLSVASPVGNASGAVSAVLCFIFFGFSIDAFSVVGIVLITAGVLAIAIIEARAQHRISTPNAYGKGALAIMFPIMYCVLDGLGTFADAVYLDEKALISEDAALIAYELTFFAVAVVVALWLFFVKKECGFVFKGGKKYAAALLETAGQYFYVFAMSGNAAVAAPMIASYSMFSVLFSAIFLKERLEKKQYVAVAAVLVGIALLGLAEGLA